MPARFTLILPPAFRRDLEHLPPRAHDQVIEGLQLLKMTPKGPHPKIKKLKGKGIGQLEAWPYRVRYDVVGHEVHLYRVRHRREIYGK